MSDKVLIVKYFGQIAHQPELLNMAARALPHASAVVSRGLAAYKRVPATRNVSDNELIDEMFGKNHSGYKSDK